MNNYNFWVLQDLLRLVDYYFHFMLEPRWSGPEDF